MNTLKNLGCCDPCNDPCGGCKPANYDKARTANKCDCPDETDTTLSIDYSGALLNYAAERHTDQVTGKQLGSIINIGDLRDVEVDYTTEAHCYELIYTEYGDCGEGCKSLDDKWHTFSIDNDGALGSQIRFVRGANRYGCPYFLNVPSNQNQWWLQGWRGSSNENGYFQPRFVSELPKDAKGNYYVMSIDPTTKEPIYGTIPWACLIDNLMGNGGVDIDGVWQADQGTGGFRGWFDKMSGDFTIDWTDWNDVQETRRAGYGQIKGKMNWDLVTDPNNGQMTYHIHNVYFERMTWTVDQGVTEPTAPRMQLSAINASGNKEILTPWITFGKSNVNESINRTIQWEKTILVNPGGTVGPMNFAYIYVDWVNDDEGYMGAKFTSNYSSWNPC